MVAEDVCNGLVSPSAAERDYGVVVDVSGCVDVRATEALRALMRGKQPAEAPPFNFGPARDVYRERWPVALEDAIAAAIAAEPSVLRQFLHGELKRTVAARLDLGERVAPDDVPMMTADIRRRFGAGYPSSPTD
jgi:N-methylhydantoinase B